MFAVVLILAKSKEQEPGFKSFLASSPEEVKEKAAKHILAWPKDYYLPVEEPVEVQRVKIILESGMIIRPWGLP